MFDWNLAILCNTGGLNANSFSAAMMPETDRTVLNIPVGIDLPTRLAHEAQCTNVRTRLTELSRHIQGVRVIDKSGRDISAHLTDLCCGSQVDSLPANLVSVFANRSLRNS